MKVYVAGALADIAAVREAQSAITSAGHRLVHDWTRGLDVTVGDYAQDPDAAARIARTDLLAVLEADAFVLLAHEHPGRGMFVELGAALARVERGDELPVVVVGPRADESAFYFHPAVQRHATVEEWLASS